MSKKLEGKMARLANTPRSSEIATRATLPIGTTSLPGRKKSKGNGALGVVDKVREIERVLRDGRGLSLVIEKLKLPG
jgi:hypothetical protein